MSAKRCEPKPTKSATPVAGLSVIQHKGAPKIAVRVGRPMDHNNLYHREYRGLPKAVGLAEQGFTFHSLRHTFGTALFKRGEHPKIVQSLLGHASIVQTMDTYSHLLEDIGGDAVRGLGPGDLDL